MPISSSPYTKWIKFSVAVLLLITIVGSVLGGILAIKKTGPAENVNVTSDVMLITGGHDESTLSSVEIFDPNNPSLTCTLPNMTVTRDFHAAVAMTVCGGDHYGDVSQSCETLDGQQWTVSQQLQQKRENHVMWQSPSKGMMLMGGWDSSGNTVESLREDGSSVMEQWKLKYDTRYSDITNTE